MLEPTPRESVTLVPGTVYRLEVGSWEGLYAVS